MSVSKIIQFTLLSSVLTYAVLAVVIVGPPNFAAPWLPTDPELLPLVGGLAIGALVCWAIGLWLGLQGGGEGRLFRPADDSPKAREQADLRWQIVTRAMLEAGALFGLVDTILVNDARPVLVAAAVTVVAMLIVPGERRA